MNLTVSVDTSLPSAAKVITTPGRTRDILVTKTQLEGTSPQVDNRGGVCLSFVRGKIGGSSSSSEAKRASGVRIPVRRDSLLAKRASEGEGGGRVAREASGVCEG